MRIRVGSSHLRVPDDTGEFPCISSARNEAVVIALLSGFLQFLRPPQQCARLEERWRARRSDKNPTERDLRCPKTESLVADASPSKELFVDMLTRDITLSECILDLIDNSIHSLVVNEKLDVMDHLIAGSAPPTVNHKVEINFSPSKFSIKDNCGGITLNDAEHHVFLLGKPSHQRTSTGLGLYGIGMKRAFFKIGRKILVKSKTREEEFEIPIDVEAWKAKPNQWHFPIEKIKKRQASSGYFSLEIADLTEQAKTHFSANSFRKILEDKIALAYALFIQTGLRIEVNGTAAKSNMPQIGESDVLNSVRHSWKTSGVDVLIMAGINPKKFSKPGGWYIFCNGRMVLEADKTEKTGWGVGEIPGFHPKYNRCFGIVYIRSKDLFLAAVDHDEGRRSS